MKANLDLDLIVYDFDGVMTNNKVYLDKSGTEIVQVNRSDGLAISEIKKLGIEQIILSSEENEVVSKRAEKLKIDCLQAIKEKEEILMDYCVSKGLDLKKVAYIGNDINDYKAMKLVAFPLCPSDANEDIKKISLYVLKSKGGEGVVREFLDYVKS
ncbi:uncharacterized protein METZ01_LOCUS371463 [marine metagenome]|uniref:FCP1 homology domain-containing protein n=1 Tax=marine metagenome TaxID=408172 RepID=A0A382T8Y9_9ZZZZ